VSNHPEWANQNPVGFRAPSGRLWLFHTTQKGDQQKDIVYALSSDDQGASWSAPQTIFSRVGLYLRQPLVIVHNRWIFPVYHSAGGSVTSHADKDHSYVEISGDSGATWNECDVEGSDGLVQMNVVKMSEDHLLAFFRSRYADWIYKSESTDGCHWSVPVATKLPNNNSSIQVVHLKDGHLAIIFNNTQATTVRGKAMTGSRLILSVGLSEDGGKTWPWVRDVENGNSRPALAPDEDPEYSYPSISQMAAGNVVVAYTFRRETIKYMTFDEQWIKEGSTVGGKPEDAHPEDIASAKRLSPGNTSQQTVTIMPEGASTFVARRPRDNARDVAMSSLAR
jgi:predicted neuraminidase